MILESVIFIVGFDAYFQAIETLSTRILNPNDDEAWTILTAEQVISLEFTAVWPQNLTLGCSITNVEIRGRCPVAESRRILVT